MELATASPSHASQTRAFSPELPSHQIDALWEEMIARHRHRLAARLRAALARCGLGTADDLVEDLMQEVLCRLLERHGRSLSTGPAQNDLALGAYLGRMAERAVVDRVRYLAAAKRAGRGLVSLSQPAVAGQAAATPDGRPTPEERALSADRWRRLWRAFSGIELGEHGPRYRLVLALVAIAGWSSSEVAGLMPGRPSAATASVRLHRLRHRLRRAWASSVGEERRPR